jgi:uncharacterized membrane protein (UPF0127 family)
MAHMITKKKLKLIKNLLQLLILCSLMQACFASNNDSTFKRKNYKSGTITLSTGDTLKTYLAIGEDLQSQGLSGVQPEHFGDDESMLFVYETEGLRRFWMPDTYFNLDIFFLDHLLRVIDIERNMPAHPGRAEPPKIARSRTIRAWHVLEIKSSSPHARKVKIGDQLKFESTEYSLAGKE